MLHITGCFWRIVEGWVPGCCHCLVACMCTVHYSYWCNFVSSEKMFVYNYINTFVYFAMSFVGAAAAWRRPILPSSKKQAREKWSYFAVCASWSHDRRRSTAQVSTSQWRHVTSVCLWSSRVYVVNDYTLVTGQTHANYQLYQVTTVVYRSNEVNVQNSVRYTHRGVYAYVHAFSVLQNL